jgi:prepilin-type N-terminal cleavage/methylation domain-containing protein
MLLMEKSNMKIFNGFTMVELLIATAIVVIVSAIGIFSWNRFAANNNLRAAAGQIEADLMLLKQTGKQLNLITPTTYTITFDLDNNNYTMFRGGLPIGSKTPSSFARDIRISSVSLALVGTITGGSATISGQARGTLNPASGSIVLSNNLGSTATITYNVTGKTYVTYIIR